jgi:GDP-mannose 6-dehydrogenase
MNVSVFGLGYVGCVTASCLARDGHRVIGVDINDEKVAMLNAGQSPIVEPGLAELIAGVVADGRLSATASADQAVTGSDVALVCVGTPDLGHGQPDLDGLARVTDAIGRACAGRVDPFTLVIRSTVPPGTLDQVRDRLRLASRQHGAPIRVAANPEFMREGSSIRDFDHPPFVVIGCDDPDTAQLVRSLYASIEAPVLVTAVRSAEMVKYVCNAFHALKVCFANEIADVCDALGADAQDVMRVFRLDHKLNISAAYLTPGFAFGGSCLPKDLRALLCMSRLHAVDVPLLSGILPSNDGQVRRAVEAVLHTRRRRVGVVGLAFKPDTDDLRESPMVTLVETLIGKGYDVRIHDPRVVMARLQGANRRYIETEIPHLATLLCPDLDDLIAHAEVLVIGAAGPDAALALGKAGPGHTIIDLTRGVVRAEAPAGSEVPICAPS